MKMVFQDATINNTTINKILHVKTNHSSHVKLEGGASLRQAQDKPSSLSRTVLNQSLFATVSRLLLMTIVFVFFNLQTAYAEDFCSLDSVECGAPPSLEWGVDYNYKGGYPTRGALIDALNAQGQAGFSQCLAKTPPYSCTKNYVSGEKPFPWTNGPNTVNGEELLVLLEHETYTEYFDGTNSGSYTREGGGTIAQANVVCPAGYYYAGTPQVCFRWMDTYLVSKIQPSSKNNTCGDKEGNPCNPSTGNKSQTEVDYSSSANTNLSLSRYYNSQSENLPTNQFALNWQHSFASSMDKIPQLLGLKISRAHTSSSTACSTGFNQIRNSVWSGVLARASSEISGEDCRIFGSNGKTIATFKIKTVPRDEGLPSQTASFDDNHIISKPDGSFYVFKMENGTWKNKNNPSLKLESVAGSWVFTNSNNVQETYNVNGQLTTITQTNERATTLQYDLSTSLGGDDNPDTLDTVTDESGKQLVFHYSGSVLDSVTTPDGDIQYGYGSGNLTSVTYPDNTQKLYKYENTNYPNHLTGIIDEKGVHFATWGYGGYGKAISSEHANGVEKVTLHYYSDGNTVVKGALGDQRFYHFTVERGARRVSEITGDQCRTCGNGFMKTRTYDTNGFLNGYTNWQGNQTTIINNARGLPTQQTDAVGTAQERTTSTAWHSSLNVPVNITEPNSETTFTYTNTGQLLTQTITDPATGETRTTTYTYHALGLAGGGLIASVDGARTDVNDITLYDYDAQDNLNKITNALGHETRITSHDASGRPLTIVDANNVTSILTWDLRGRLLSLEKGGNTTNFEYDPVGQLIKVTQPDGSYLSYIYDDAHRLTGISDNADNKIKYVLDKMGNRTSTSTTDTAGNISYSQTAVFDKLSRLKQNLGANSQKQILNYDLNHNALDSTDALTHRTQSNYDALDRLIKSIDPDLQETDFEYDNQDNLTKVTDAKGLETTYIYNGFDEVTSQTSPDTGTTSYTYDKAGNRTSTTDARGIAVNYSYNAINQLLTTNYPDNAEKVTYRYDLGTRRKGRVYDMRDQSGRTIFSYDTRGNTSYRRHDINSHKFITRYYYDNANNLRLLIYPSGRQVLYTRNTNGRINRVRMRQKSGDSWSYLANTISYQPFGNIKGMTFGNGLAYNANFDLDARLVQQTLGSVLNNSYAYNEVDNLVTIDDAINSALNQTFNYDNLDRLDYETGGHGDRYFEYDAVGSQTYTERNWTASNGTPRHTVINLHPATDANQLRALNNQADYVYDNAGNTLSDSNGRRTFTYNDAGRLETLSYNGNLRGTYTYNGQGQRVKKVRTLSNGNTLTYYFQYDQQGQLLSEVYHNGARMVSYTDYIWLAGHPIAQVRSILRANGTVYKVETRYLHTDHLNTPRKATDENGTIVWRWDSDAYGHTQPKRDPDGDGRNEYVRLRFAGQYHDAESGLFYNYFRYYDPYTGRYVTSDPIGLNGGINTYAYVLGNPLRYVDSLGLAPGDFPPKPPGYNPKTWPTNQLNNGKYQLIDPDGNRYIVHPEDKGHWRHWDVFPPDDGPGGGGKKRLPSNSKKTWPNQKRPAKPDQCPTDPNGDAKPWEVPDNLEFSPLPNNPVPLPVIPPVSPSPVYPPQMPPFRIPIRIPIFIPI